MIAAVQNGIEKGFSSAIAVTTFCAVMIGVLCVIGLIGTVIDIIKKNDKN